MLVGEISIRFPHLGIEIADLGSGITIGGFTIAYYGIIIAIGMMCAILLALSEVRRTGQSEDLYIDFAMFVLVAAIVGARLYYVIFEWDSYKDNLLQIFNLRAGGLAIYGGIIAGTITLIVFCIVRKQNFFQMADVAVIGLLLGQIIGRWGNFFNKEAFGKYTDSFLAMQVNLSEAHGGITQEMLDHVVTIDGTQFISVHPTFLYESLWNLGILLFIMLFMRYHKSFQGELMLTYFTGYGLGRVWIEGLRTDQLQIGDTGIAVSQALSGVLFLVAASAWIIIRMRIKTKKTKEDENT